MHRFVSGQGYCLDSGMLAGYGATPAAWDHLCWSVHPTQQFVSKHVGEQLHNEPGSKCDISWIGFESICPWAQHFLVVGMVPSNRGSRGCWNSTWAPKGSQRESSLRFLSLWGWHPSDSCLSEDGRAIKSWVCHWEVCKVLTLSLARASYWKASLESEMPQFGAFSYIFLYLSYLCRLPIASSSIFTCKWQKTPILPWRISRIWA